jgi:adenosylcobyric acid synthase
MSDGSVISGYEIHHGNVIVDGGESFIADEGCVQGSVAGSVWHGLFENDSWRRTLLIDIAQREGKQYVPDSAHDFAARRESRIEILADFVEEYLDTNEIIALLNHDALRPLPKVKLSLE